MSLHLPYQVLLTSGAAWQLTGAQRTRYAQPRDWPRDFGRHGARASGAESLHCSFCTKSQHNVQKLIAGPSVYICDECVDLCVDVVRDGIIWRVLSRLRSSEGSGTDALQSVFEHVRSRPTEEVVSYVEQSRVGVQQGRRTLEFIDRRLEMPEGEIPQEADAQTSQLFAHLKTNTKEELVVLRKNTQRELMHYEDALRIGTTVLDERRRNKRIDEGDAKALEAAREGRIANRTPSPGTEESLRRFIDSMQRGRVEFSIAPLTPDGKVTA